MTFNAIQLSLISNKNITLTENYFNAHLEREGY